MVGVENIIKLIGMGDSFNTRYMGKRAIDVSNKVKSQTNK